VVTSQKKLGWSIPNVVRLAYTLDSVKSHLMMKPNPTGARNRFAHFARALFEIAKSGERTMIEREWGRMRG
jgi:hypothetical protein